MTTNLLIFAPEVPDKAIKTSTSGTWGDTIRLNELSNNRCGPRGNLARLQTATTGRTVISCDMGASGAQSVDHLAVSRADLLQSDSVASLIVRGSAASAFAPSDISGLQLWLDPSRGVTTSGGSVSAWTDRSSNAYPVAQSTAANRPVSSGYDTRENLLFNSQPTASGDVSSGLVSNVTFAAVTSGDWASLFSTAAVFADNSVTRLIYYNRLTSTSRTYTFTAYVRMDDGTAPSFSGSADFSLVINGSSTTSSITTESLGGGLYRISKSFTGNNSSSNHGVLKTASNTSKGFKVQGFMLTSTSYSTYVATTTTPIIAGINGSRKIFFDGSNDRLLFTNTPSGINLTGDFTISTVFNLENLTNNYAILNNENRDVAGYFLRILTSGALQVLTNTSGAHSSVNSTTLVSAGQTYVYTAIQSSGTLTHYINGTAAGSGALTNAASASGQQMYIGFDIASTSYFSGSIGDIIVYNSALSSTNRQLVEAYLTAKYQTTPLVADYALAPNAGEDTRDYLSVFSASSSYRHFWFEMDSSASSKFTHSKLFLGAAVDLGETVNFISCQRPDDANDDFQSDSGAIDLAAGKGAPYQVSITWKGITDAQLENFLEKVVYRAELRQGLFLCTTANHQILDGHKLLYVRLSRAPTYERNKADYNTLTADFEELTL